MAFSVGSEHGETNGTTAATLCSAPAVGSKRIIKNVTVQNDDSAAATLTLSINDGTDTRTIFKTTLAVGDQLIFDSPIVLDDSSTTLEIVLSGAVTTNELPFTAHFGDES